MRHYPKRRISRRTVWRDNPLRPKDLSKKLEELTELGLSADIRRTLETDLSGINVDPANAIYVIKWWAARLALLGYINLVDNPKLSDKCLTILQNYANEFKLSAHDLALDGELQIDYWEEFRHFIQMSGANPYFREEWPILHKVFADMPTHRYYEETERVIWLGKLIKGGPGQEKFKLTSTRGPASGFQEGDPAIKLIRGEYATADPDRDNEETELPISAIIKGFCAKCQAALKPIIGCPCQIEGVPLIIETRKPSDMLAFLRAVETTKEPGKYFIPEVHHPFLSFPDGKCWVIVDDQDREAEKVSFGDCATGQYSSSATVVISLREPVLTSPQGTYYRTRLRAEIVFPSGTFDGISQISVTGYEAFGRSMGVVNQLRGAANSKPPANMHKYIIPLLEQGWVSQLVRPSYRPDEIFWPSDLSKDNWIYLREKNPKLFNAALFYNELKDLDFPSRIKDQIVEGIDFPISYIVEALGEVTAEEFSYYSDTKRGKIVSRSLKRRLEEKVPDPELQQLLQAAEAAVIRLQSQNIAAQFREIGFELSTPKIYEVLEQAYQQDKDRRGEHPLLDLAVGSLTLKIKRKEGGLEAVQELVRQIMLEPSESRIHWPPRGFRKDMLDTGVVIQPPHIIAILKTYLQDLQTPDEDRDVYYWKLALHSIKKLLERASEGAPEEAATELSTAAYDQYQSILEEILLHPNTPYSVVTDILDTKAVELSEIQIARLLSESNLIPGLTLAALVSLKRKLDGNRLTNRQKLLRIAEKAMLRLKHQEVSSQAIQWFPLPINGIIKVLLEPKIHPNIRKTAIDALRQRINTDASSVRSKAFNAIKSLLLRTKDKSQIRELLAIYKGHQHQYRLFHDFITARVDWLTLDRNRTFFLDLIRNSLPKSSTGYSYTSAMPKPLFNLLKKMLVDGLVTENTTFIIQLLFEVRFDESSLLTVRALLEKVLDVIIKDPSKLTSELCSWYQHEPGSWGRSSHRVFLNSIAMSPKLLRQFMQLLKITEERGNDCYLDLAITIAQRMPSDDRKKMIKLATSLMKSVFAAGHKRNYHEYLTRLLNF